VFRARVLARTLLYVFFLTSTFFRWFFSNYVQDYTYVYSQEATTSGSSCRLRCSCYTAATYYIAVATASTVTWRRQKRRTRAVRVQ
jgi:hypothetical protein